MNSSKKLNRWLAGAVLVALVAAGVIWGRPGYLALRYRHYEEIRLPDGAGTVTFFQSRVPNARAVAMHGDPESAFSGATGELPLKLKFEVGGETFTFVFPGAEAAQETGEIVFVRSVGPPADETVIAMIEERSLRYPDLDWYRMSPLPPPPVAEEPGFGVGVGGGR